jgi:hypothetical protein
MDILYLVGDYSTCDFEDLKFSLRSLDMYGENVSRVFICGYIPYFISDEIIKIPFEILPSRDLYDKARNIYKQIIYAVKNSDIGINDEGEFLVSMDDHYITQKTDFGEKYPFYVKDYLYRKCRHMLPDQFEKGFSSSEYQKFLVNCCLLLKELNLPFYNFCPHRNMHMNRFLIEELEELNNRIFENNLPVECFCLVNNYRLSKDPSLKYEICADVKTNNYIKLVKYINSGCNFFSTSDFGIGGGIYKTLMNYFPNKSKYEK